MSPPRSDLPGGLDFGRRVFLQHTAAAGGALVLALALPGGEGPTPRNKRAVVS